MMRENTPATAQPLPSGQAAARRGIRTTTRPRAAGRGAMTPACRTPGGSARFRSAAGAASARRLSSPLEARIDGA